MQQFFCQVFSIKLLLLGEKQGGSSDGVVVIAPKSSGNYQNFDKTQVKLFPNFTRKPFDYLLMSWVTNYAHNCNCKITRVLYPTAREESSPGFSQGYFRHTTSQKPSPS